MQYENHELPEDINYSTENPVKEFFWLLGAVGSAIAVLMLVLHLGAKFFAPYIPFAYEQKIAQSFIKSMQSLEGEQKQEPNDTQCYLQNLSDEISIMANLPQGMHVTVHYSQEDVVNAFATLGGHITIYQGILNEIETENALTMLMAHEIAHVKHRDPIVGLSRGVISSLALGLLTSSTENAAVGNFLGSAGLLTQLKFSRAQEEAADKLALQVVKERFGHVNGAESLFQKLHDEYNQVEPPAFMSSHPATQDRIDRIVALSNNKGKLTKLPELKCP